MVKDKNLSRKYSSEKQNQCDPDVKSHLEALHGSFAFVTIDKSANIFQFICKKYYISKLLTETITYSKTTNSIEQIIQANINYCQKHRN